MEGNGIKYAAGAVIIGAALLGIWAVMTWEFQGEFPENEFTIEVCNCDSSVTTEEIEWLNNNKFLMNYLEFQIINSKFIFCTLISFNMNS